MTMISSAAGQPAFQSQTGGFGRLLRGWANDFVAYFVRREAIRALREMDDRELRDIGIERSRIESAVRGVVDPTFGCAR
jgi:uncharacterized protein YjiS (DUF1127 family)